MAKKQATKKRATATRLEPALPVHDRLAIGKTRVEARQAARRKEREAHALDAYIVEVCAVLAAPTSYCWGRQGGQEGLEFEASLLVVETLPDEPPARTIDAANYNDWRSARDYRWRAIGEELGNRLPATWHGDEAMAWAVQRGSELALDRLWVDLAQAIRQQGTTDKWLTAMVAQSMPDGLLHLSEGSPSVDLETIVEVGREVLGGLLEGGWKGDGPDSHLRARLLALLGALRRALPETFRCLGWIAPAVRKELERNTAARGISQADGPWRPPRDPVPLSDGARAMAEALLGVPQARALQAKEIVKTVKEQSKQVILEGAVRREYREELLPWGLQSRANLGYYLRAEAREALARFLGLNRDATATP